LIVQPGSLYTYLNIWLARISIDTTCHVEPANSDTCPRSTTPGSRRSRRRRACSCAARRACTYAAAPDARSTTKNIACDSGGCERRERPVRNSKATAAVTNGAATEAHSHHEDLPRLNINASRVCLSSALGQIERFICATTPFGAHDYGIMRFGAQDYGIMRFRAKDYGIMNYKQTHNIPDAPILDPYNGFLWIGRLRYPCRQLSGKFRMAPNI
jgi:hypothetical protein